MDGSSNNTQMPRQVLMTDGKGKVLDHWTSEDVLRHCPLCGAFAITELTPRLKAIQPDGTTLVCNPGFGGCNQGFAID